MQDLYAIFDLDGTLLDTLQDLAAAGNHTLSAMGLPTHHYQAYKQFVGNGVPTLVQRMLPEKNRGESTLALAQSLFEKYYTAHMRDLTAPYPGIVEMLANLKAAGVQMAVLSNKPDALARPIVEDYFPGIFPWVMGLAEGFEAKPHPGSALYLLRQMGAAPTQTLYVGDSNVDMQTAAAAGLRSCGVLWGFRTREELLAAGANLLAENAAELEQLILAGPASGA